MDETGLDPQAAALLERFARAGVRPVSEQTPAAARRAGLRLVDIFDHAAGDAAIVRHLNRTGGDGPVGIAAVCGIEGEALAERLEALFLAGVLLRRPAPDGGEIWTVRIGGRRRARTAGGALDRLGAAYDAAEAAEADEEGVLLPGGVRDVTLAPGVELRIYRPEAAAHERLPFVFFVHGGGWVIGSISSYDGFCRSLMARSGVAVVSINYRLAPEDPFPAAVEDVERCFRWTIEHADRLGLDASRIAVMGDSVGGGLATIIAIRSRDAGWAPIALQVLVYPVTDATMSLPSYETNRDAPLLTRADMEWNYRHYAPTPGDWRGSPLHAPDLAGLPPAHVLVVPRDVVADDGLAYAERLRTAGVPVTTDLVDGVFHGFLVFSPTLDAATAAQDRIGAAIRDHLGVGL